MIFRQKAIDCYFRQGALLIAIMSLLFLSGRSRHLASAWSLRTAVRSLHTNTVQRAPRRFRHFAFKKSTVSHCREDYQKLFLSTTAANTDDTSSPQTPQTTEESREVPRKFVSYPFEVRKYIYCTFIVDY